MTHTYTYGNADWKDLLTAYDGKALHYDGAGNPLTYQNGTEWTLAWEDGRRLSTATSADGTKITYTYDLDGTRRSKTVDGVAHYYIWEGGRPLKEYVAGNTLFYFYDHNGRPFMLQYNGEIYYYILNLQGDVYRLVDSAGKTVAQYSYDPWGKVLTATGSMAEINPLRYRGYYYDRETGWYYLNSRYYDPQIGRFINADAVAILTEGTGTPAAKNLFAYCDNNPVTRKDAEGTFWESALDVVSLCASVAEVMANPADPWAWAGLAGDALDLVPFVTGVGELTKVAKVTVKALDNSDDVIKATRKLAKSDGIKKFTGSYEIMFESGKNYTGKGGLYRSTVSAKFRSVTNNDRVTSISWTPSSNSQNAFIAEYNLMKERGVRNNNTYNRSWSPGRSILQSVWSELFGR